MDEIPSPRVVHRLTERQQVQLHALYQREWWSKGRSLDNVRTMLSHMDVVVGLVHPATDDLLAFARVLTDRVFKATIYDVIVDERFRGRDLGRQLVEAVVTHEIMRHVRHVELYCKPELVPFYEAWGFREDRMGVVLMRREWLGGEMPGRGSTIQP